MTHPFMTPAEVAAIFGVHPKTVTRWAWPEGSAIKTPGGHWRYRRAFVIELTSSGAPSCPET